MLIKTDLSVIPVFIDLSADSSERLRFDAGETITTGEAALQPLDVYGAADGSPVALSAAVATPYVDVTVEDLERGTNYEVSVTFTNADARVWTRTLIVRCVA